MGSPERLRDRLVGSDEPVSPPPFKLVGGNLCLDLVNTLGNWHDPTRLVDYLSGYDDLLRWSLQTGALGDAEAAALARTAARRASHAEAALAKAKELRRCLRAVALAATHDLPPAGSDLAALNRFVSAFLTGARLVPGSADDGYALARQEDPTALDRPLWPVVRAAIELLTSTDLQRVRECAGDACGWLFLDTSRGGRRRWCDMADCGNLAKARRFRVSRAAAGEA